MASWNGLRCCASSTGSILRIATERRVSQHAALQSERRTRGLPGLSLDRAPTLTSVAPMS
jgi:hypothetical protein